MRRHQALRLGLTLVVVGLFYLLEVLGVGVLSHLWKLWPLVLLAVGVDRLALRRKGLPDRLAAPEILLLGLVTVAGLVTTMNGPGGQRPVDRVGRGRDADPVRPPEPPPQPPSPRNQIGTGSTSLAGNGRVVIDVANADLEIVAGPPGELRAELSSSDGDLDPGLLAVAGTGTEATVSFARPASSDVQALVHVTVPSDATTAVRHRGGKLDSSGKGLLDIKARQSRVSIENADGAVTLEIHNGSLATSLVSGSLTVVAAFSRIHVSGARAGLTLTSTGSDIDIEDVTGALQVDAADGEVAIENATGEHTLALARVTLRLEQVQGAIGITARDSTLALEGTTGSVKLAGTATGLAAEAVQGPIEVSTTLRSVTLRGTEGPIRAHVEDANLSITGASGPAEATVVNGRLRLTRIGQRVQAVVHGGEAVATLNPGVPFDLTANQADVRLDPRGHQGQFDLRAAPGQILAGRERAILIRRGAGEARVEPDARGTGVAWKVLVHHGTIRIGDGNDDPGD